jgi:hypothetical protein
MFEELVLLPSSCEGREAFTLLGLEEGAHLTHWSQVFIYSCICTLIEIDSS